MQQLFNHWLFLQNGPSYRLHFGSDNMDLRASKMLISNNIIDNKGQQH